MELHLGPEHPERPARIIMLHTTLTANGLMGRCWQLVPRKASDEELLRAHTAEHIHKVDTMFGELYGVRPPELAEMSYCFMDGKMGDMYICEGTAGAARYAAGCCVEAVRCVMSGSVTRALAVVRPPGHHAECDRAMGFCFFNNVAVAALDALATPGINKVAVLDWDVHHGNGIQHILYDNPNALYISIHRDPKRFYPYTSGYLEEVGQGSGTGFNVNLLWLRKGMGDGDYMAAFSLLVEPMLGQFAPDLVIVAAGYDAAEGDPLGGCKLSPEGYAWMTERLLRFAGGRLVLALEGGYNTRVTAECASACLEALLRGEASPPLTRDKAHMWPSESHASLKQAYEFQAAHWPSALARPFTQAWEAHLQSVNLQLGSNSRSKRGGSAGGSGSGGAKSVAAAAPAAAATSLQEAFEARRAARVAAAAAAKGAAATGPATAAAAKGSAAAAGAPKAALAGGPGVAAAAADLPLPPPPPVSAAQVTAEVPLASCGGAESAAAAEGVAAGSAGDRRGTAAAEAGPSEGARSPASSAPTAPGGDSLGSGEGEGEAQGRGEGPTGGQDGGERDTAESAVSGGGRERDGSGGRAGGGSG
ncbi:hypothetical protein HYH03_001176 [Edaphochlamys debaryana]|uniref:histone deacetylase n=1 Tax=Edaphochlamys debaryana TaxID=47281 RepID=A0A836C6Q1_9CHLO|nr:hypothetical protein HYH03_001176 [Edaphochlamys debaryana]|eukprot:KAG2501388.1 hypothetical protein HYH03_001176 [Edaphochlamys debaryana]